MNVNAFLVSLGLTRDHWLWLAAKLVSAAAMVTTGVLDPVAIAAYLGIHLSTTGAHWIFGLAIVVLYLSGQYSSSPLPGKKLLGVLLLLLLPATAQAQALPIDKLTPPLPTAGERTAADVASWGTSIAAELLDAKASWDAGCGSFERERALGGIGACRIRNFELQGARVGATYAAVFLIKTIVHRARPCAPADCGTDSPYTSLPSGHTALAFSSLGGPSLGLTMTLGLSTAGLRVMADKHYLTDVLLAIPIGAAAGHWIR